MSLTAPLAAANRTISRWAVQSASEGVGAGLDNGPVTGRRRSGPPGGDGEASRAVPPHGDGDAPQPGAAGPVDPAADPLARFSPLVRDWFAASFAQPTPAQAGAWQAIRNGDHTLVVAPTGSGKTLAAFLSAIDDLVTDRAGGRPVDAVIDAPAPEPDPGHRCRVLYLSPLKALAVDVERNLRSPLAGIRGLAAARGEAAPEIDVAVRSGDTTAAARRDFARSGADILITTPESLFLILTSAAREMLRGVHTVIVDEVHAVAGTKRGAHLAVSLDRLDALLDRPAQRIGLSATVRPLEEVARFLAGGRPVSTVVPPAAKQVDIQVVVPVPDLAELGGPTGDLTGSAVAGPARSSIWPHVEERVADLVESHRSTIVFANSRRLAERLTARLNEIHADRLSGAPDDPWTVDDPWATDAPAGSGTRPAAPPAQIMAQSGASAGASPVLARAHHGSVSREQRTLIEDELKSGRLPAVVATSSLELGIDMGAVDLVVQVEAPPSVASGLQRIGRAGHQVGAPSKGVLFPKFRGDLVSAAVAAERMRAGQIEQLSVVGNPLDVAAQQIVAICAMDPITVDDLHALLRRSAPFASLGRGALEAVLDMLSGRYPSEQFAELRPRLVWDRISNLLTARPGAQRLAVTSGGTIPDRGLYGVFLAGGEGPGLRVGELDEEMVYESRVGDVFVLGSTSWRIVDIGRDRVLVLPAPGIPGRLPFWKADSMGRPAELGRAHGAFIREIGAGAVSASAAARSAARRRLQDIGLDEFAADNLLAYLAEQHEATGVLPDERTLLLERFRDELGDWRVVLHSPYGAAVHAPWALVIAARMRERYGVDVQAAHSDDGIVLRLPDVEYEGGMPELADLLVLDPATVREEVTEQVGGSAVFAARFRECAARALLLPRRQVGRRQPLWQQRQRAAQLLEVAAGYPSFPIVAEAVRECLADVFDVASLVELMRSIAARQLTLAEVTTTTPSPFARSLLFGYVAQFIYEGDSPLAERRAAALTVDPDLLAELLGSADAVSLRDLLDPAAVAAVQADLQRLSEGRRARNDDEVADLLRILGPLSEPEIADRSELTDVPGALARLTGARRAIEVRIAGQRRWADPADAGVLRDALGVALPVGVPEAFLGAVDDPLGRLLGRYARTHGPFGAAEAAARFGLGIAVVRDGLARLGDSGRIATGEFRPLGTPGAVDGATEYVDSEVLRLLRRRSLAALRADVEPVPPQTLGGFLPAWNGIAAGPQPDRSGARGRGADAVLRAVEQLAGALVPASALETLILPARVPEYTPAMLDEVMSSGEVLWTGHGALGSDDGWISLHLADSAPLTLPVPSPATPDAGPGRGEPLVAVAEPAADPVHLAVRSVLARGGGYFFPALVQAVRSELAQWDGGGDGASGPPESAVLEALWDLVFAGVVTGDTLAPLRARLAGGHTAHRSRPAAPRARMRPPSRLAVLGAGRGIPRAGFVPPTAAGRWSAVPAAETDPTIRLHAAAEVLLDRYGIVTRGSVLAEQTPGGFAGVYRVLAALEESGRIRRGYFVEGLGAAQFAGTGAVDRIRAMAPRPGERPAAADAERDRYDADAAGAARGWPTPAADPTGAALVLAAADPANAYGAALPWPEPVAADADGHRPARRAGALVCLVDGVPALYAERGGRTVLSFTADPVVLDAAASALAGLVRRGRVGSLTISRVDGESALSATGPVPDSLQRAGFVATPRGLRLRAGFPADRSGGGRAGG
jgi:ATP-dependent Lhr-like helicase